MISTNNYPKFQEWRNEKDIRPLVHRMKRGMAMFRLEDWRDHHYDIKFKAMRDQKREPHIYCDKWYGDW